MQSVKYEGSKLYQKKKSQFKSITLTSKAIIKHQTRNERSNGLGCFFEIGIEKGQRIKQIVDTNHQN